MNKLAIASDMLNAIRGLELTPLEVKCLTVIWISHHPFLLKDFGWEVETQADLQNIMADIEKLKAMVESARSSENLVVNQALQTADTKADTDAPSKGSETDLEPTSEPAPAEVKPTEEAVVQQPAPSEGILSEAPLEGNSSEAPLEEKAQPVPRKGYSKNGKKLGRPAYKKPASTLSEADLEPTSEPAPAEVKPTEEAVVQQPAPSEGISSEAPSEGNSSEAPLEEKAQSAPRKGYSKNGKKLGRPPRQKPLEEIESPKPTETAQKTEAEIPETTTSPQEISPPVEEPEKGSDETIRRLKYGKKYEYDLLYWVDKRYIRSRFKLQEEAGVKPIGVVIPYTKQKTPYEMVVYYEDEHASIPLSLAEKYAKSKLTPYKKVPWRVKNPTDDVCIRPVLATINEIFKKMGGDEIKGDYVDGRGQYYGRSIKPALKIRYVCDIPL